MTRIATRCKPGVIENNVDVPRGSAEMTHTAIRTCRRCHMGWCLALRARSFERTVMATIATRRRYQTMVKRRDQRPTTTGRQRHMATAAIERHRHRQMIWPRPIDARERSVMAGVAFLRHDRRVRKRCRLPAKRCIGRVTNAALLTDRRREVRGFFVLRMAKTARGNVDNLSVIYRHQIPRTGNVTSHTRIARSNVRWAFADGANKLAAVTTHASRHRRRVIKVRVSPAQWIETVANRTITRRGEMPRRFVRRVTSGARRRSRQRGVIKHGAGPCTKTRMAHIAVCTRGGCRMSGSLPIRTDKRAVVASIATCAADGCVIKRRIGPR